MWRKGRHCYMPNFAFLMLYCGFFLENKAVLHLDHMLEALISCNSSLRQTNLKFYMRRDLWIVGKKEAGQQFGAENPSWSYCCSNIWGGVYKRNLTRSLLYTLPLPALYIVIMLTRWIFIDSGSFNSIAFIDMIL